MMLKFLSNSTRVLALSVALAATSSVAFADLPVDHTVSADQMLQESYLSEAELNRVICRRANCAVIVKITEARAKRWQVVQAAIRRLTASSSFDGQYGVSGQGARVVRIGRNKYKVIFDFSRYNAEF